MTDKITTTKTEITTESSSAQPNPSLKERGGDPILMVPPGNVPPLPVSAIHLDQARIKRGLLYYLTLGIRGLLGSKKGTLVVLILIVVSVGLFLGKLSGETFVAAITVASGIYTAASTLVDVKSGGFPNS